MPYEHKTTKGVYHLATRSVELKGGRKQQIYFFCKIGAKLKPGCKWSDMPAGKKVGINARTGLPFLANKAAAKK
ncbi:MAG: hypothetical protein AABX89_00665 [Candidatus Thermoplasmatota archaeon]